MKNFLFDIFGDQILSLITKQYGTKLSDSQKHDKVFEILSDLKSQNQFTVDGIQNIIDKKGLDQSSNESAGGKPVYAIYKLGLFKKVKCCYFITRIKEIPDGKYLEQIYDELRQQANGTNVFGADEYKNG